MQVRPRDQAKRKFGLSVVFLLFAHPAAAIDCGLAKSEAEKAICSDPEARSADEALGKSYVRLRNSLIGEDSAGLGRSQVKWIGERDEACRSPKAVNPLSRCLAEKSRERQRFLDGKPHAGDVLESLFRPRFVFRPAKNGSVPVSIEAIRFAGGGVWQSRLNAGIESAVQRALSDSEAAKNNPGSHDGYYVDLKIDLAYASSRMVSVHVDSVTFVGQAHPDYSSYNINLDRVSGRELTFDSILDDASAKPIFEICRSEVARQKRERSNDPDLWKDDVEIKEVIEDTKNLSVWQFNSTSAGLDYGAYAFGGYGRCTCTCTIPYSMLRPLAKKEFPLP
jgi:uncharacterized protein YecT (DUF1311 family)